MNRATPAILAAITVLTVAGCTSQPATNTDTPPLTSGNTNPTSTGDPTADSTSATVFAWGETYDGAITTTISAPVDFTTSATAMPEQNAAAWAVDITLVNTTDEPFNPLMLNITGFNGNRPAQQVFDSANGYGGTMNVGDIAPGQKVTVAMAFLAGDGAPKVNVSSITGDTVTTWTGK